jgi:hypothetical protein
LDKRYRSLAWGALFILVGSLSLIPGDQTRLAILTAGVILLALNLARSLSGIPMNGFSIALGAASFIAGAMVIFRAQLGIHFEVQLIPIVLIAIGLYFLWPQRKPDDSGSS